MSSRFKRELKKLECSVNYNEIGMESGLGRVRRASVSSYK